MLKLIASPDVILSYKNHKHAELLLQLVEQNRAYLRKWMRWVDETHGLEEILAFMKEGDETNIFEPSFAMEIWYRNELSGIVGFNNGNALGKKLSIGYWLSEKQQGKGIVTASCKTMINYTFQEFNLAEMQLFAGVNNLKSRNIAERLGFTFYGIDEKAQFVNGEHIDLAKYQLNRQQWQSLSGSYS